MVNSRSNWQNFRAVWLKDIVARGTDASAGLPMARRLPCLPDVDVAIPAISFGQVNLPDIRIQEYPTPSWTLPAFQIRNGDAYVVRDVVVHGELGIVTAGDFVLRDSLHLSLPEHHGYKWIARDELLMPPAAPATHIDDAAHMMCGYVGNRNYAHWLTDVVPSLFVPPISDLFGEATLLFSHQRRAWQQQTLALWPEILGRCVFLDETTHVSCSSLAIVPQIKASDWYPHPGRMIVIDEIRRRAGANSPPHRRIYVSRQDAGARRLINEDDVVQIVQQYGFDVVMLAQMDVVEQIRLFSSASHIVAPHGAGLANIVFCQAGTVLCELFMNSFVQWGFRRLAGLAPMTYGCLVGTAVDWHQDKHTESWTLPLDALEQVLRAPPLIRS
jgi:capsular polysaccharide biosynthesis protein